MALQSCHHHHPPLPEWEDWGWGWEELLRCQLGDAARDGIHGAFPFPALAPCGAEEEEESPVSSSSSGGGGYLEDAVAHWGDRSKRQRTEAGAAEAPPRCPAMASEDLQCLLQSFWDSSSSDGDLLHDLNTMAPAPETSGFVSGEGAASGREGGRSAAAAAGPPPPFSATAAAAAPRPPLQKATTGSGNYYCGPASSSSCSSMAGRKEGVLYPFAVVRPLVLDGDTLSDVNRRILKRPARPVRHPVGEFACGPAVSSPHGPGLSGKAVVSLTKIRTGGKGTITIIRTRG